MAEMQDYADECSELAPAELASDFGRAETAREFSSILGSLPYRGCRLSRVHVTLLFGWLLLHCVDRREWEVVAKDAMEAARQAQERVRKH